MAGVVAGVVVLFLGLHWVDHPVAEVVVLFMGLHRVLKVVLHLQWAILEVLHWVAAVGVAVLVELHHWAAEVEVAVIHQLLPHQGMVDVDADLLLVLVAVDVVAEVVAFNFFLHMLVHPLIVHGLPPQPDQGVP